MRDAMPIGAVTIFREGEPLYGWRRIESPWPWVPLGFMLCEKVREAVSDVPLALLERALAFYERSPDGQYDSDVVVPLLRREIGRRLYWGDGAKAKRKE